MLLAVLKGDESKVAGKGTGKVLKSTADDNVFFYYSDHGSKGLVAMPDGVLYATDFNDALKTMHSKNMYKEMLVYIEACHSGSMFDDLLPENVKIYATTAAHADESSYAYYCYPNDVVKGTHMGTCLGDEYSIRWMEDSDKADMCSTTVGTQYDTVNVGTRMSHVQQYGEVALKSELIGDFQATQCDASWFRPFLRRKRAQEVPALKLKEGLNPDCQDAKLHSMFHTYMIHKRDEDFTELHNEVAMRKKIDDRFDRLLMELNMKGADRSYRTGKGECYKGLVELYREMCGFNEYDLKYLDILNLLCFRGLEPADAKYIFKDMCHA